jgi:hypothetical protein
LLYILNIGYTSNTYENVLFSILLVDDSSFIFKRKSESGSTEFTHF